MNADQLKMMYMMINILITDENDHNVFGENIEFMSDLYQELRLKGDAFLVVSTRHGLMTPSFPEAQFCTPQLHRSDRIQATADAPKMIWIPSTPNE